MGIVGETAAAPVARRRRPLGSGVEIVILTILFIVMLFPVVWMLETALKDQKDIYAVPAKVFHFHVTFQHFKDAFKGGSPISVGFKNSLIVGASSTILATLFGVPAAWAYSRFNIPAKK